MFDSFNREKVNNSISTSVIIPKIYSCGGYELNWAWKPLGFKFGSNKKWGSSSSSSQSL